MNTTVVKMARKSAAGVAKYSASRLTNCGNQLGSTIGSTMSSGTRNSIWRVSDKKMDLSGCPETSCQGLFNQIHEKATKKVPEADFSS